MNKLITTKVEVQSFFTNYSKRKKSCYYFKIISRFVENNNTQELQQFLLTHPDCNIDIITPEKEGNKLKFYDFLPSIKIIKTPLMIAIDKGFHECSQILLDFGCDPNALNEYKETAIFFALNNPIGLEQLVKHGADINFKNKYNENILIMAINKNKEKVLRNIIHLGADIHPWGDAQTAIHYAVKNEKRQSLKTMLRLPIDINAFNRHDETAAAIAVRNNDIKALSFLLKAGARTDISLKNLSLYNFAKLCGNDKAIENILKDMADKEALEISQDMVRPTLYKNPLRV